MVTVYLSALTSTVIDPVIFCETYPGTFDSWYPAPSIADRKGFRSPVSLFPDITIFSNNPADLKRPVISDDE
jgi:hypothetical protein